MKRLTLAGQMALLLAVAILVAQAISFGLILESRRTSSIDAAIVPAAQRLANAAANPGTGATLPIADPTSRAPQITAASPIAANANRFDAAETRVSKVFAANRIRPRAIRAVSSVAQVGSSGSVHLAAQLPDGRWISIHAPAPTPIGAIRNELMIQALAIYLILLVPSLLLLRRLGRSLAMLADASHAVLGPKPLRPLPVEGPRDVRMLVNSFNQMQQRLSAMVAEKNVMLGALGHDLRTPLTALRLEAAGLDDVATRTAMERSIDAMHGQLENILTLARFGGQATLAPLDLAGPVIALVDSYRSSASPVSLEVEAHPLVLANAEAIQQALRNLIDNGLRYAGAAHVRLSIDGEEALLEVADDGPGIAPDRIADALAPFGRLDASRGSATGGHGLGLTIVESVARLHGGRLDLAAHGPPGLTARLFLPLV